MPSDSNGVYSLPSGYLAVNGQTIQPLQHNPPLEDIAAALTARLMASGANAMTGPLKLADGSAVAPSLTLASATGVGFYKNVAGKMVPVGVLGTVPVGVVTDYAGASAPSGWLLCNGASLLRADYPDLFIAIGTIYGAADGTHFTLPNANGRVTVGKGDNGVVSGSEMLAAIGGAQSVTLDLTQIPSHDHGGATGGQSNTHTHNTNQPAHKNRSYQTPGFTNDTWGGADTPTASGNASIDHSHPITAAGGNAAHTNLQPYIVFNKIIFAGV